MKAFLIWIIFLVIIGLAISYFLIPNQADLSLIQFKSNQLAPAEKYYREQYEKGIRTPEVIIPLSIINERRGNLDEAIAIIKKYLGGHPEDTKLQKKLADLYHLNQQYEEYYQTLLIIYHQEKAPDPDVLQGLASFYQEKDMPKQLQDVLEELIATGKGDKSAYFALAQLKAEKKDYAGAVALLEKSRALFPKEIEWGDIFLEVDSIVGLGRLSHHKENEEHAVPITVNWLLQQKNPQLTRTVLETFSDRFPQLYPSLLNQLKPVIDENLSLRVATFLIDWNKSKEESQLFPTILKLFKEDPSNVDLVNVVFNTYVQKHDEAAILEFLREIPAKNIEERGLINFALLTITENKPLLAKKMENALGEQYLKKHRIVALALGLAIDEKLAKEKLNEWIKNKPLTQFELYSLFQVIAAAKLDQEALVIGAKLFPYVGFTDEQLFEIVFNYIQMKKVDQIETLIHAAEPKIGKKVVMPSLIAIDIAKGNSKKAALWLHSQKTLTKNLLNNFYFLARDSKEYSLALDIAELQMKNYPSIESEAHYGYSLVLVKDVEKGMALLGSLYKKYPANKEVNEEYFSALALVVKKHPQYLDELRAYMATRESQGSLPTNLLREFAFLYVDSLREYRKAENAFWILSQNESPQSLEVQNLVYLWGPKVSREKISWLMNKAAHSSIKDLAYWLQDLIFVGASPAVIAIFENRVCEGLPLNSYFAYMDALVYEKKKEKLRWAVDAALPHVHEKKHLKMLSGYASDAEYLAGRRRVWEKIVHQWPSDPSGWQNLAEAAFDENNYRLTDLALARFFELSYPCIASNPQLYKSYYAYAEVLKKHYAYYKSADWFSWLALQLAERTGKHTVEITEFKANILYDLDRKKKALGLMCDAYERSNRDPDVASTYADMMMDAGCLRRAGGFLQARYVH